MQILIWTSSLHHCLDKFLLYRYIILKQIWCTGNAILDYRWVGCSLSKKKPFVVVGFLNKINYLVLKRTTITHLITVISQSKTRILFSLYNHTIIEHLTDCFVLN